MNRKAVIVVSCFIACYSLSGQGRKDLEEQRKKTLDEIGYVDNLIKETEKQKTANLNEIRILGNKLKLRENVITGLNQEILLLNERIALNTLATEMMESDLEDLKKEYARTIIFSYKATRGYPELAYVLSARDFNQGYKRLRYLQQLARYRRTQAEIIAELREQIETSKRKMVEDLRNISGLKSQEESQKTLILQEQNRKRRLQNTLSDKEKQLRKELEEKKRIAQKIEAEINKIIEEERRKASGGEMTPEMKLIGTNFAENRGRLPWPVEKGIITERFGKQEHPVLNNVVVENPGIEITSTGSIVARSVFKGEVVRIFAIQGANMSIIIKHGNYYTVYQNLINVRVSKGQIVETKQQIGEVFKDEKENVSVLKFSIFIDREKSDPESWLSKKI